MKKITMKEFIEECGMNPRLIRSVVRQSGGWETFKENAPQITKHGIDGGFNGWITYTETMNFFRNNRKLILDLAEERAQGMGEDVLKMVQSFGVFKNDPIDPNTLAKALYAGRGTDDDVTTIYNVMAWFAVEEVTQMYDDLAYERR